MSSVLDNIAQSLSNLERALELQNQAATIGFDWDNTAPIFAKLQEEITELTAEVLLPHNQDKIIDELGDLFFVVVNLARHLKIDPELAILHANNKFERRFRALEIKLSLRDNSARAAGLEEMDAIWDEIKHQEKTLSGN